MAEQTLKRNLSKSGYVNSAQPTTVIDTNPSVEYELKVGSSTKMYFGFAAVPVAQQKYKLVDISLSAYIKGRVYASGCDGTFNESSLTYNNAPAVTVGNFLAADSDASGTTWLWSNEDLLSSGASADYKAKLAWAILQYNTVCLYRGGGDAAIKTVRKNGTSKPWITITYDDAVTVTGKIKWGDVPAGAGYYFHANKAQTFNWDYEGSGGNYRVAPYVQASAKFYWRVSGGSWHTVDISGNTRKYTVPANTFPIGQTIEVYVKGTDEDGAVTSTSTLTYTTATPSVEAASYPSGNNNNPAGALSFSWTLKAGNQNYDQKSATFYWKVDGASSYNSVAISGNTKSYSAPANTFPSGATILWHVTAKDADGNSSSTTDLSFGTLATAIAMTAYPSGSSVQPTSAQIFSWTLTNNNGANTVAQKSGTLYYKLSTASSWSSVAVGTAKTYSFTANTFKSGSTYQWYLSVVDATGVTKTVGSAANPGSFSTQATSLSMAENPSGSTANPTGEINFAWTLTNSSGNVGQTSGTLYLKKSTDSTFTTYSVGTAKQKKFAANALASGTTYQWYLEVVDVTGVTKTQSSAANPSSFTTQATTVAASWSFGNVRPDPTAQQTLSWTVSNASGTVTQKKAVFYYKLNTASSYTSVSISGNTKSYSLPSLTMKSGSTYQWYLEVTDSTNVTKTVNSSSSPGSFTTQESVVTVTEKPSGSAVNPALAQILTWTLTNSSGNLTQASATVYWKNSTDSSYQSVSVSGNTKTYTFPAGTFPTATTINYYITAVDPTGVSVSSTVGSFTTFTPTVAAVTFPSGNAVDPSTAITFTWSVKAGNVEYIQASAKLCYRASTTDPYTEINISGNTKSATIPADTLPTATSVQWYIQATDAGGHTSQTSATSFTTVSPTITPDIYPSGNNVDPGIDQIITWKFAYGTSGDYAQQNAKLYWRKQGAVSWNEITADGATKSATIPRYAMPTGSTVEWYITGTDAGGHVSTASTKTFKTLSTQITPQTGPTSGYADPRYAITVSWVFKTAEGSYPQSAATFRWRYQGETDNDWRDIAASGSTTSISIPANTIEVARTVEWYITGTDSGGLSSSTSIYTFSTSAAIANAYCRTPAGTVEDGTKPVSFGWTVETTDGASPLRIQVQWKTDTETSWRDLYDSSNPAGGSLTGYTAPADTFPSGPIQWRVRAYNRDSVVGPYDEAAFVCLRAPDAPTGLSASTVPLSTIQWQSVGQEAYELCIDDNVVEKRYGPDVYSYCVKEPLKDGYHTIELRIQGEYGLWSNPTSISVYIENQPGADTITLQGDFGIDALLSWTGSGNLPAGATAVYRDGKLIANVQDADSFTDRLTLGEHVWIVERWLLSGNYVRSNAVSGRCGSDGVHVALMSGGPWISLRLSEQEDSPQDFRWERTSTLIHVSGARYPILELSPSEDITASYDCAFRNVEDARTFEALRGKVVIIKSRQDHMVIGAMTQIERTVREFYIAYRFAIQQIHWEDFVNVP